MASHLLHGTLVCTIFGAENLVDELRLTGSAPKALRQVVGLFEKAVNIGRGPSRLYATVDLGPARVGRTRMVEMEPVNPVWMEHFQIYCAHYASEVVISIKDDDVVGSHVIGRARIPVERVLTGNSIEDAFDLYSDDGKKVKGGGRVRISMRFFGVEKDVAGGWSLPKAFYAQQKGCHVTLYQDAHMREGFLPRIYLDDGQFLQRSQCWEDINVAIADAKMFIYIAGWSVYTEISLRRHGAALVETLGDLLKRKAEEGVSVAILVWDDRTSVEFIKPTGVMGTHDQETMAFFRNSKVKCVLCPRTPDSALSAVQGMQISTMFTHHQKLVSVDVACAPPSSARKIVSFIGGIDLCNGRFDDQRHSLFRTLNAEHSRDFYQGCFRNPSLAFGGPRQPWHDIHCKLEGPVAWDVLANFQQRWYKQGVHGVIIDLANNPHILPATAIADGLDQGIRSRDAWKSQLFRSIDAGAAFDFPDNPADAARKGLVSGKDNVIERSIQDAYIRAIRRAHHFIYIENQYFLGSCHAWDDKKDAGCLHLIPMEIVLKIVSKIEAGERFVAYIVIPMWPEGIPETAAVQSILDWQRRTMEMMYKKITIALQAANSSDKATDYLCFFCLGNRETQGPDELLPQQVPQQSPNYLRAQENRRFMIYVHSKMMIVDDEYIILGSANINQRSMDGGRDTELAVGAYQSAHTWKKIGGAPRGQVHGFRMSLWYEHIGFLNNLFLEPWSLECVRCVRGVADKLWELFAGEDVVDLHGHLLTYPVIVAADGAVTELPGHPDFPDTTASIVGKQSTLPTILTT